MSDIIAVFKIQIRNRQIRRAEGKTAHSCDKITACGNDRAGQIGCIFNRTAVARTVADDEVSIAVERKTRRTEYFKKFVGVAALRLVDADFGNHQSRRHRGIGVGFVRRCVVDAELGAVVACANFLCSRRQQIARIRLAAVDTRYRCRDRRAGIVLARDGNGERNAVRHFRYGVIFVISRFQICGVVCIVVADCGDSVISRGLYAEIRLVCQSIIGTGGGLGRDDRIRKN